MNLYTYLRNALWLSAIGIYFHAISIAIVIGFSVTLLVIEFIGLWKNDKDYINIAKKITRVIVVAFGYGAATGTLVEFGLVQVWNGILLAIGSYVLIPLYLELIAFILEATLLAAILYTWDKFRNPWFHWIIVVFYTFGALLSGSLITSVNAWMQAPWGVGSLVQFIYPWAPVYGPNVSNTDFLIALKDTLVNTLKQGATGSSLVSPVVINQLIQEYGPILSDPWIALKSLYALHSIIHQLLAASLVGISWVGAGLAYKALKNPEKKKVYFKVFKVVALLGAILLFAQALEGHGMGVAVYKYQPTKFAMIAGLKTSGPDPIVGLTMFGNPNHIFNGFDKLLEAAQNHPHANITISGISLKDIAVSDTLKAEANLPLVYTMYTVKIGCAGIALIIALLFISAYLFRGFWEKREKILLYSGLLYGFLMPLIAGLGWAVREIGRKPWTVYGLLYPEELITPVEINPLVGGGIVAGIIIAIILMFYTIYVVLTHPPKILLGSEES